MNLCDISLRLSSRVLDFSVHVHVGGAIEQICNFFFPYIKFSASSLLFYILQC